MVSSLKGFSVNIRHLSVNVTNHGGAPARTGIVVLSAAGGLSCVPSMNTNLEVQVLWGVDRSDPSEPQGAKRERLAERSG